MVRGCLLGFQMSGWAVVVAAAACGMLPAREASAQAGNAVDGAVWRIGLDRVGKGRPDKLKGAFRINNYEMFQRESDAPEPPKARDPQQWSRRVGGVDRVKLDKNKKDGNDSTVVWTITDLVLFDENRVAHRLDGTIKGKIDEAGHWSGRFIDGKGHHWNFKVQRIQE